MSSVAEKLQRKDQRSTAAKQVRLKLVYIDFWSVVKLAFLIWVCLGVVLVVATILVWIVLFSTGVFGSLDSAFQDILSDPNFTIAGNFGLGQVGLFSLVVAILNVVEEIHAVQDDGRVDRRALEPIVLSDVVAERRDSSAIDERELSRSTGGRGDSQRQGQG